MVTRTTTGGVLRNYKYNLQRSFNTLTAARDTVLSQRTFENFAEDPATATQCFQLRRAMLRTNTQYNVAANLGRQYDIAYAALDSIISRVDNDINYYNSDYNAILRSLNDPTGGGRLALGQQMKEMAEGMVQTMNSAKYGDIYVFGGSDGLNTPFAWNTNQAGNINLNYRDTNANAAIYSRPTSTAVETTQRALGYYIGASKSLFVGENTSLELHEGDIVTCQLNIADYTNNSFNNHPQKPSIQVTFDGDYEKFSQDVATAIKNQYGDGTSITFDPPFDKSSYDISIQKAYAENGEISYDLLFKQTEYDPDNALPVDHGVSITFEVGTKKTAIGSGGDDPTSSYITIPGNYTLSFAGMEINGEGTIDVILGEHTITVKDITTGMTPNEFAAAFADAIAADDNLSSKMHAHLNPDGNGEIELVSNNRDPIDDISKYDIKFHLTSDKETPNDYNKLDYYVKEGVYVDIGIGLAEDGTGRLIESSAFNSALPGVAYLGWGLDEDGDPNNIISISWKMGEILSRCNPDDGRWASEADKIDYQRLAGKFEDAAQRLKEQHTVLTTRKSFLDTNQKQLSDAYASMNEQLDSIERVDLADAISSFSWAQYCYNAALKMGNSILSQSLMDYLN